MDFTSIPEARKVQIPTENEKILALAVDAAFQVHVRLGPGLLESVYENCFSHELDLRKISYERQKQVPLVYRGREIEIGFRTDILIEGKVLVELKAVETLSPVHTAQVITYLKLLHLPVGLLINFNEVRIKFGINRVLNVSWTPDCRKIQD